MSDYPRLLRRRARHAAPRDHAECFSTTLQERNAAALIAWRIRWSQRRSLPDTVDPNWRLTLNLRHERKVRKALAWINATPRRVEVVIYIHGRK